MKRYCAIICLLFSLVSAVFAQGLIWSEPVILEGGFSDAVIIGSDSLLYCWQTDSGVSLKIYGPDGFSDVEFIDQPGDGPKLLKTDSGEIFVFTFQDTCFCSKGNFGDWERIDILPIDDHTIDDLVHVDYLDRPCVYGKLGYWERIPFIMTWEDTVWTGPVYPIGWNTGPIFDAWNIGDSTIIRYGNYLDSTLVVQVFTDSTFYPMDTIGMVSLPAWSSPNFFWAGDSIWYYGARIWDTLSTSVGDTSYIVTGYGNETLLSLDTIDINPYRPYSRDIVYFDIDACGNVWTYWNTYNAWFGIPDLVHYIGIAKLEGSSFTIIDTSITGRLFGVLRIIFDKVNPFPNYIVYRTLFGDSLLICSCEGYNDIYEELVNLPSHNNISIFPNPFNSAISISAPENATVEIFDINGRIVYEMPVGSRPASTVLWQPDKSVPSGVYLVRARFDKLSDRGNIEITKRVVYLK